MIVLGAQQPGPVSRIEETITGQVSDVGTGVASLTAVLDGESTPVSFDAAGNFSYTTGLPLNGSADGPHLVNFVAVDRAGNSTSSAVYGFTLDTQPPSITVSSPTSGESETRNFVVSGQVSDASPGPTSLSVSVDGGATMPVTLLSDGSFAYATTLKLDGSNDGPNSISLIATDQAGNTSAPTVLPFTLETRGPALSVQPPPR